MSTSGKAPLLRNLAEVAFVAAVVLITASIGWVGYLASDDQIYADAAEKWLQHAPYVGTTHWTLRYPVVVPIAAAFALFGEREFTLVLPTLIYFLALLLVAGWTLRVHFDHWTAAIAVVTIACIPLFGTWTTAAFPDVPEAFFCLLSLALFAAALDRPGSPRALLVASGAAAGCAWLTRETTIFFVLTYVVLVLRGFAWPRRQYLPMAGGFAAVIVLESLFLYVETGNPLYRLAVAARTHLKATTGESGTSVVERLHDFAIRRELQPEELFTRTGNLSVSRLIDPFLAGLVNNEFMLFYYLATPLIVWLVLARRLALTPAQRRWLVPFGLAGLLWFSALWAQIGMTLDPRYFLLPTVIAAMVAAIAVSRVLWPRSRKWTLVVGALFLSTSALGTYVGNRNPLFGERVLVETARGRAEPIHTDPNTKYRSAFLLRAAGVQTPIQDSPPPEGSLYFHNPKHVGPSLGGHAQTGAPDLLAPYRPKPAWEIVSHVEEDRRWTGSLLERADLARHLPPELYRRLDRPNPSVTLYRVQERARAASDCIAPQHVYESTSP